MELTQHTDIIRNIGFQQSLSPSLPETLAAADLDSDGIQALHEKLTIDSAAALAEGLGERARQIHLQRIVGAYVGSAHGAGVCLSFTPRGCGN